MNNLYGGYSSVKGAARHDLSRRRTLKRKSDLLKGYGFRCIVFSCFSFLVYLANKKINPPEYRDEEEQEKAEQHFGVWDGLMRGAGWIFALRERNNN